jgi:hypothetical protein
MLAAVDLAENLDVALKAAKVYQDPFPLSVYSPFSPALYAEILRHLPEDQYYDPLYHNDALRTDGTSTRLLLSLRDQDINNLPRVQRDFWSAFNHGMRSKLVCDVFLSHMETDVLKRFGKPLNEIVCYPTARLGRDWEGFKILPHPDGTDRVYTAQVYLPKDEKQIDAGTTVYARREDGQFDFVRTLPFKPNTGFCFVRTDATYHGVEPLSLKTPRDSLHLSGFTGPKDF